MAPTHSPPPFEPVHGRVRYRSDGERLPALYNALVSNPNISSLSLKLLSPGCVVRPDPWAFEFHEGDRFPALKELTLRRYRLDHEWKREEPYHWAIPLSKQTQKHLGILKTTIDPEPNLEKWLRAMDWAQLEILDIDHDHYFLSRMKHELPNLSSLTIEVATYCSPFCEFLEAISLLESLKIWSERPDIGSNATLNCSHIPMDSILRHGPTLASLTLAQAESHQSGARRRACSTEEIERIYGACPNLTHFGLDVDRDGSWPQDTLDALVAHEGLSSLHLRFELGANLHGMHERGFYGRSPEGLDDEGPYREPRLSKDVVETMFNDLRAKKRGNTLQRLRVEVGDWPEESYLGPLYSPYWWKGREMMFVCEAESLDAPAICKDAGELSDSGEEDDDSFAESDEEELVVADEPYTDDIKILYGDEQV